MPNKRASKQKKTPPRPAQPAGQNALPRLTVKKILEWADNFRERTGKWPAGRMGPIPESPGLTWALVCRALRKGTRGLPGGSSLARELEHHRSVFGRKEPYSEDQILEWARAYLDRHGVWPTAADGVIPETGGLTWSGINKSLFFGSHGLPGGSTLKKLLVAKGVIRSRRRHRPSLNLDEIWKWAQAYQRKHGDWPRADAGPVEGAKGETWAAVNGALSTGLRGLPGGSSLRQFLMERNAFYRSRTWGPKLAIEQIWEWGEAFRRKHGHWPRANSGPVEGTEGETWLRVNAALTAGLRSLPGKSSLRKLFSSRRPKGGHS